MNATGKHVPQKPGFPAALPFAPQRCDRHWASNAHALPFESFPAGMSHGNPTS
jgi:hypothetical protein